MVIETDRKTILREDRNRAAVMLVITLAITVASLVDGSMALIPSIGLCFNMGFWWMSIVHNHGRLCRHESYELRVRGWRVWN